MSKLLYMIASSRGEDSESKAAADVKDHGNSPPSIMRIPQVGGAPVGAAVRAGRRALMASRWRRMR
jgi:hypothetical protein